MASDKELKALRKELKEIKAKLHLLGHVVLKIHKAQKRKRFHAAEETVRFETVVPKQRG